MRATLPGAGAPSCLLLPGSPTACSTPAAGLHRRACSSAPSGRPGRPSLQGVGEFQCYDRRALASLAAAAREAGHPEWGNTGGWAGGRASSFGGNWGGMGAQRLLLRFSSRGVCAAALHALASCRRRWPALATPCGCLLLHSSASTRRRHPPAMLPLNSGLPPPPQARTTPAATTPPPRRRASSAAGAATGRQTMAGGHAQAHPRRASRLLLCAQRVLAWQAPVLVTPGAQAAQIFLLAPCPPWRTAAPLPAPPAWNLPRPTHSPPPLLHPPPTPPPPRPFPPTHPPWPCSFFLEWYSGALLDHGERMLTAATSVFNTRRQGGWGAASMGCGLMVPPQHLLLNRVGDR